MEKPKVLVIVGPTASGKTSLSIELAKRFNGEVISADSRQVYRGLDLGTGKVTKEEMQNIPHHLLDVADPKTVYTVADFVRDGRIILSDIHRRGSTPLIVGGSFFYVDALLGRVTLPEVPPNDAFRAELEEKTTEVLFELLKMKDERRAEHIDKDNRRRLIRAVEVSSALGTVPLPHSEPLYNSLILGIDIDKEALHTNIHERLISRIDRGMIDEVKHLHENGISYARLNELGIEYHYSVLFLQGKILYEEMLTQIETKSRQFAKRQMTWLKRDKEIVWVQPSDVEKINLLLKNFLK